jgi:hypothetical protein
VLKLLLWTVFVFPSDQTSIAELLDCAETQIRHATHVKEYGLAHIYNTKKYVLANDAPRYDAGSLHIYMRFGKVLYCAAVRTLSLCARNINSEYFAQFTCGSITVKVVVTM